MSLGREKSRAALVDAICLTCGLLGLLTLFGLFCWLCYRVFQFAPLLLTPSVPLDSS